MNLGGPDRPEAVQPFLFNLFNDPAIIGLPALFRWPLAKLISARRAPIAQEIYRELGGGSPLLANTEAQAAALKQRLEASGQAEGVEAEVFIAMRYWHPMSEECVAAVKAFGADRIVLLPLYPQFSTTTVASSVRAWRRAAAKAGITAEIKAICCYPTESGFVEAVAAELSAMLEERRLGRTETRLLFSAHGLPKKIVEQGDPYQWQVERSVEAVVERLSSVYPEWTDPDFVVCYQSRVGPLEWIGPSTEGEIVRAGQDGKSVVLVPIAFVSEHSETLVELDIEYRRLADDSKVPGYHRVPTVGAGDAYMDGLARLVGLCLRGDAPVCSQDVARICPAAWSRCREHLEA